MSDIVTRRHSYCELDPPIEAVGQRSGSSGRHDPPASRSTLPGPSGSRRAPEGSVLRPQSFGARLSVQGRGIVGPPDGPVGFPEAVGSGGESQGEPQYLRSVTRPSPTSKATSKVRPWIRLRPSRAGRFQHDQLRFLAEVGKQITAAGDDLKDYDIGLDRSEERARPGGT